MTNLLLLMLLSSPKYIHSIILLGALNNMVYLECCTSGGGEIFYRLVADGESLPGRAIVPKWEAGTRQSSWTKQ